MTNDSKLKQATYILHSDGNPTDNILCIDEGGAGGYEYFKLQKNKENRRFIYEDTNGRAEYEDSVITEKIRQDLDNEIVRAKAEESRIENKIDNEITRSTNVDNTHDTEINSINNTLSTYNNTINELRNDINNLRNDFNNLPTANGLISTEAMSVQFNNPQGSGNPTDWLRSAMTLAVSADYNYFVLNAESKIGSNPIGNKLANVTVARNANDITFYASLTENVSAIDYVDITFTLLKIKK